MKSVVLPATLTDNEIVTTRLHEASRERVWEAWTDPLQVAKWWDPNGFRDTINEMDVRPGGSSKLTMHSPDGAFYTNRNRYVDVVKAERIVYDHLTASLFHMTIRFEEMGGKTNLTRHMGFETAQERDRTDATFGAVEGAIRTLARLADYLG